MIFACGVRFIRLRSVSLSGCASRSARAACSTASALIARIRLAVLPEVLVLLMLRRSPGRNQADAILAFRISHIQQYPPFRHSKGDETGLAIVLPIINKLNGKRVLEHR